MKASVLAFVNKVLIPVQCHYLGMKGAMKILVFINKIKMLYNSGFEIGGLIPAFYNQNNNLSKLVLTQLIEKFRKYFTESIIRQNISLAEAPLHKMPVFDYSPKSHDAEDFKNLVKEVITKDKWNTKKMQMEIG